MIIIIVNVKKTTESELSVLLRIFTNYAQLITTTMSFSTNYPTSLTNFLIPMKRVGQSSEVFLSFDCFVSDYEIKGPFPSNAFFKLFLIIFLPFIIFFCVALIWVIVYSIKRKWVKSMERYLVISFLSIVFLLHPKLAQEGFSIFRCVKIDDSLESVRIDTDME